MQLSHQGSTIYERLAVLATTWAVMYPVVAPLGLHRLGLMLLRLRLMLGSWLICDQARLVPVIQWVCPHFQVLEMVAAALEGALITVVSTCLILITLIQVVAAVAPLVVALV